ncbi:MAG: SCP2 sterol-binding domain-containing protein [Thermoplasmata archaeon]|nr:SCP2 sterol-binding domain-containing protein [Thermoplasmata archaeon]
MEDLLSGVIEKFNERVQVDEKLQRELEGVNRKVQIEVTDGKNYNFVLDNVRIENFAEGNIDSPDITIISDTDTIFGLFNKEIGPMKALATKKLRLKGSLSDMLKIRKLF